MLDDPEPRRRQAAERQRRRRERRARGAAVLKVEIDAFALSDALVEAGWLAGWDAEDPAAIARAVEQLLLHLIERHA